MKRRSGTAGGSPNGGAGELGALQRRIQYALLLITFVPIVVFSACILRYVNPGTLAVGPVAAVLAAVLVLMLAGTRMLLRIVETAGANGGAPAGPVASRKARSRADRGGAGGRSIRHTIAEAVALIGAIPLLAFGYVVVKYILPAGTTENLLLVTFILAVVVSLGIVQIYRVVDRVIDIAAGARRLRTDTGLPAHDDGDDELGALSSDLGALAGTISLREYETRRLRSFMELLPEPLLVVDRDGAITVSNKAAQDLLGYGSGELGGKSARALFANPEDPAWLRGEGGDGARENLWLKKDGGRVPVSVRVGRLGPDEGGAEAVIVATDITKRNRALERLTESERRARSMFEDSPISLWMEDFSAARERIAELARGGVKDFGRYFEDHPEEVRECAARVKVVDVNRATLSLYEAEGKKQMIEKLTSLFRTETWSTFVGELLAIAGGKTWYECDTEAVTLKGNRRHVNLTWTVVPGFEETYGRVLVSILDITDRARAATELRRERDTLRKYMDVSRAIILVLDLKGRVALINRTGCEMLGRAQEEIVGRNWFEDFVPARIKPDLDRTFAQIRAGDTASFSTRENPILTRSGGERQIEWRNAVLTDEQGAPYGILSSGHDVTEQRKLEEHLFHARKMESVGTLAGGIAHDFNNILAGIVGYAYLVKQGLPPGSRNAIDLDAIERLAMRGSGLTKALLAFAHGGDYAPEPAGVDELVGEAVRAMERTAPPNVRLETSLAAGEECIFVDRHQFHQCLMNLCVNACEAMPDGGTLSVTTTRVTPDASFLGTHPGLKRGAYAAISVSDTGVGISPRIRERLFDPFFTTKPDRTGNGLGLPVAHGIVERAGGTLAVESAPGKGSTFIVYMPVQHPGGAVRPAPAARAAGGGRTILLVDDEIDFRNCAARWLARLGYRVLEASSGEEALRIVEQRKDEIGMVLLDMVMKAGGGTEAFRGMRAVAPGLCVLLCSGYTMDNACQELIGEGAAGFVQKPFEHAALAARIGELLGPPSPSMEAEG